MKNNMVIKPPEYPPLLSVVVPCYNEEATLAKIVQQILAVKLPLEVIIVDDGSSDKSREVLAQIAAKEPQVKAFYHDKNRGKGAALATGFEHATGAFVIVQDADLEYDPREYSRLLEPALTLDADVVFGSRFKGQDIHRVLYYWHSMANWILTTLSNMTTNLNVSDMETCYKLFRREIIQGIELHETRFGFEPEVTAKIAKMGCRVYEIGISYNGRPYEEGKKIGFKDAVRALYCVIRYGLLGSKIAKPPREALHPVYAQLTAELYGANQQREKVFQDAVKRLPQKLPREVAV